ELTIESPKASQFYTQTSSDVLKFVGGMGHLSTSGSMVNELAAYYSLLNLKEQAGVEPRQPGGCKLKTAPVRPVVAARPAEYVCSEDLFY
ncbi:hypothetical protein CVR96_10005, partial [Salmonella enterica subsp. enterica serovar Typhimurium]|uniref:nitrate- and nitrite sensing domain-containing protein n=1 Tax=Salmonella enterica TaxID=28901 RepID=UPI000CB038F6